MSIRWRMAASFAGSGFSRAGGWSGAVPGGLADAAAGRRPGGCAAGALGVLRGGRLRQRRTAAMNAAAASIPIKNLIQISLRAGVYGIVQSIITEARCERHGSISRDSKLTGHGDDPAACH